MLTVLSLGESFSQDGVESSILAIAEESEMLTMSMVLVLMRVKSSHIWTSSHYRVRLNVGINVSCQRKHWKLFSNICQNKTSASSSRILITNFLITFSFCLFLWKIPSLELALIECEECQEFLTFHCFLSYSCRYLPPSPCGYCREGPELNWASQPERFQQQLRLWSQLARSLREPDTSAR